MRRFARLSSGHMRMGLVLHVALHIANQVYIMGELKGNVLCAYLDVARSSAGWSELALRGSRISKRGGDLRIY